MTKNEIKNKTITLSKKEYRKLKADALETGGYVAAYIRRTDTGGVCATLKAGETRSDIRPGWYRIMTPFLSEKFVHIPAGVLSKFAEELDLKWEA